MGKVKIKYWKGSVDVQTTIAPQPTADEIRRQQTNQQINDATNTANFVGGLEETYLKDSDNVKDFEIASADVVVYLGYPCIYQVVDFKERDRVQSEGEDYIIPEENKRTGIRLKPLIYDLGDLDNVFSIYAHRSIRTAVEQIRKLRGKAIVVYSGVDGSGDFVFNKDLQEFPWPAGREIDRLALHTLDLSRIGNTLLKTTTVLREDSSRGLNIEIFGCVRGLYLLYISYEAYRVRYDRTLNRYIYSSRQTYSERGTINFKKVFETINVSNKSFTTHTVRVTIDIFKNNPYFGGPARYLGYNFADDTSNNIDLLVLNKEEIEGFDPGLAVVAGLRIETPPGLYPEGRGFRNIQFIPSDPENPNIATPDDNEGKFVIINKGANPKDIANFVRRVATIPRSGIRRVGNKIIITRQ